MRGTQRGRRCLAWDPPPTATISSGEWKDPRAGCRWPRAGCRWRPGVDPRFSSLCKCTCQREPEDGNLGPQSCACPFKDHLWHWLCASEPEPAGVCTAACRLRPPLARGACQRTRAELRLQELIGGRASLGSWVPVQPPCPGKSILFS